MEPKETYLTEKDILHELEPTLIQASLGKRFANYLIDFVGFVIFAVILINVAALIAPDAVSDYLERDETLVDRLVAMLLYATFMGLQEIILKGRSLGKLCTGTRAVNEDGTPISAATALKRGFTRIVPFEPLSAFGPRPWHDRWTDTFVIDKKRSTYVE